MIRVLQCVNNMQRAGLETMLMNYYRNIDRTKIQFDFLTHRPDRGDYDDEIEAMGGRIYRAPRLYPQNYPAYFAYMRRFFQEHPEYRIVHSHIDAMSYLPLLAAKKADVPIRIAHSHNTSIDRDFKYPLKQYFRYRLPEATSCCLACGKEAGQFLFRGSDYAIVPNAIDMDRFFFNPGIREQKREELCLIDKLVIGHVGRFSSQKNHSFLIEIFNEICKKRNDTVLLLVGTGEKESEIRNQIMKLGLDHCVRFLGNRTDVNELYHAMDVFVLPSLFEGVPLVGVEAQTAGLPCVFSDCVPKEVQITDNCLFLPLGIPATAWAESIMTYGVENREAIAEKLQNSSYNIRYASTILEEFYLSF